MKMLRQHIIAGCTIAMIAGTLVWLRREPVELLSIEITQRVRPGQMVTERAAVVRIRADCRSSISAEIVDAQRVIHRVEPVVTQLPASTGEVDINRNYPVPFSAAWGHARLIVQRTYYCWPFFKLWPISNPRREMGFEIVPS